MDEFEIIENIKNEYLNQKNSSRISIKICESKNRDFEIICLKEPPKIIWDALKEFINLV